MGVFGKRRGAGGTCRSSAWLLLFTLASVAPASGCWCDDCASFRISLPEPGPETEDGLAVDFSEPGNSSSFAKCTWARNASPIPSLASWTCTHDGKSTTFKGEGQLTFDVKSASGTCTITVTDAQGTRTLKKDAKDVGPGEASMAGCACDETGVTLTRADLAPPAG
jgi:hypothetical protein